MKHGEPSDDCKNVVYEVTFHIRKGSYVGQSVNGARKRGSQHKSDLKRQQSIRGLDLFREVLAELEKPS